MGANETSCGHSTTDTDTESCVPDTNTTGQSSLNKTQHAPGMGPDSLWPVGTGFPTQPNYLRPRPGGCVSQEPALRLAERVSGARREQASPAALHRDIGVVCRLGPCEGGGTRRSLPLLLSRSGRRVAVSHRGFHLSFSRQPVVLNTFLLAAGLCTTPSLVKSTSVSLPVF